MRPHGCAHIRLMLPLNHPANADSLSVTVGTTYSKADVLMIDRTWSPGISAGVARDLIKQARADGTRVLYSIDDNLVDLKPEGFNRWPFTTEELMAIRYFAREADGIIVTTDLLKERMSRFNDRIFVVSNALDERLWKGEPLADRTVNAVNRRKIIGYMGTRTHDSDLMMILQALRTTLRKNAGLVELQLLGCVADRAVIDAFEGLPIRILDLRGELEYPAFVPWMVKNIKWDLAIAPLEDDVFTRCKSDIKFLDYSAVGIPGIYSHGPVYGKTVRHLETGYLAENDPQSWTEGLELMLTDDTLRHRTARNAQEYTFSTRTLKQRAADWRRAISSVVEWG